MCDPGSHTARSQRMLHISLTALFCFLPVVQQKGGNFSSELCTCGAPGAQQDEVYREKDRKLAGVYDIELLSHQSAALQTALFRSSMAIRKGGRIDYRHAQNMFLQSL